jgi:hypothetical protein
MEEPNESWLDSWEKRINVCTSLINFVVSSRKIQHGEDYETTVYVNALVFRDTNNCKSETKRKLLSHRVNKKIKEWCPNRNKKSNRWIVYNCLEVRAKTW